MQKTGVGLAAAGGAALAALLLLTPQQVQAQAPAFPTCEGEGCAEAIGHRGGSVCKVTNLNGLSSTPGSLGYCLTGAGATGPRYIVFQGVVGNIYWPETVNRSNALKVIEVSHADYYLAGQTALGQGITVVVPDGSQFGARGVTDGHSQVIRHMRFRPGALTDCPVNSHDGMLIESGPTVVDHCSVSWAPNKVMIVGAGNQAKKITLQWSIIAEAIHTDDNSKYLCKPESANAGGFASQISASSLSAWNTRSSIHHNAWLGNYTRVPRHACGYVDFRCNVEYQGDALTYPSWIGANTAAPEGGNQTAMPYELNWLHNYFIGVPGGQTAIGYTMFCYSQQMRGSQRMWADDNIFTDHCGGTYCTTQTAEWAAIHNRTHEIASPGASCTGSNRNAEQTRADLSAAGPFTGFVPIPSCTDAQTARQDIIDEVGAFYWNRDSMDTKGVLWIENQSGGHHGCGSNKCAETYPDDWPVLNGQAWSAQIKAAVTWTDVDNDGIDDDWERARAPDGQDLTYIGTNTDQNGNLYDDIEDWLNELAGDGVQFPPREEPPPDPTYESSHSGVFLQGQDIKP